RQAELSGPVHACPAGAGGDQVRGSRVIRAGGEVEELEVQRVEQKVDGLGGALVGESKRAFYQLQSSDAQSKGLCVGFVSLLFAALRKVEQLAQIKLTLFVEQHLGLQPHQFEVGDLQLAAPETAPLQIQEEAFEAKLLLTLFAQVQVE